MDQTVTVAIIVSIPPTLVALGALVVGLRNSRKVDDAREKAIIAAADARSAKAEIVVTRDGVFEVGRQLDGRLKELLELTRRAALAEGTLAGRAAAVADGIAADEHSATRATDAATALAEAKREVEVPVATRSEREEEKGKP